MDVKVHFNCNYQEYQLLSEELRSSSSIEVDDLNFMATIETNSDDEIAALNEAYKLGQNKSFPWHQHPRIESNFTSNLRSVSIGDVFEVNKNFYMVASQGFIQVSLNW